MVSTRSACFLCAIFAVIISVAGALEIGINHKGGILGKIKDKLKDTAAGVLSKKKNEVKGKILNDLAKVKGGITDLIEVVKFAKKIKEELKELHDFKCPVAIRDFITAESDADAHGLGSIIGDVFNFIDKLIHFVHDIKDPPNSLGIFGAKLDFTLDKFRTGKLVRQRALTAKNVSSYKQDVTEAIDASPNYVHEFFPGIKTRGFDPTLLMDGHSDQIPGIQNHIAACLFSIPANILKLISKVLFILRELEPDHQGVWTDDIPGHSPELGVPNNKLEIVQNLGGRFDWKMNSYFSKTFDEYGANQDISKRYLYRWPNPSKEPFNDEYFAQFYFGGYAQSFVRRVKPESDKLADGATYVAALDYASTLAVRPGIGKYGGDVFFDENARLMHIVYDGQTYRKQDTAPEEWENLKARCRGTAGMIMTAINHLLGVHLHFSNSMAMAVPLLPSTHKIRQLLWPHIFNAIGVNRKAFLTLSVDGGLFSRAWGLNLEGVRAAFEYHKEVNPLFRWHTPPELQKTFEIDDSLKMPLYEDGIDFYKVVRTYVKDYVALHYADDEAVLNDVGLQEFHKNLNEHLVNNDLTAFTTVEALVDVLATYIYYVTGYHTHVGNLHLSASQSGVAPSQWYESGNLAASSSPPNSDMWTTFTFVGTASLTLPITGESCSTEQKCGFAAKKSYQNPAPPDAVHQPPIQAIGYPDFFDTPEEKAVNKQFVQDLLDLQGTIVRRNQERHECVGERVDAVCRVFNTFDVNWIEMSVGI